MVKKTFDITVSFLILSMSLPFVLLISFIIWMETLGNPIFTQIRGITLENQFTLYKLRTLKKSNPIAAKNIFLKNELRTAVTTFGKILRRTGLDELPQLLNVIKGEMSLVGPRPLSQYDLNQLKEYAPKYYERRTKLKSKPGITGLWQIYGDRDLGINNLLDLDELYEKNRSAFMDIKILLRTIPMVLAAKHSDSIVTNKSKRLRSNIFAFTTNRVN